MSTPITRCWPLAARLFLVSALLLPIPAHALLDGRWSMVEGAPRPLIPSNLVPSLPAGQSSSVPAGFFVENTGQFDPRLRFQAYGPSGLLRLTATEIWLTVLKPRPTGNRDSRVLQDEETAALAARMEGLHLRLRFPGASPQPAIYGIEPVATRVSYFTGPPGRWRTHAPVWRGVRYAGLYPGIDLDLVFQQGQLTAQLRLQPGADLAPVRLAIEGAEQLQLSGQHVRLVTPVGLVNWPLLQVDASTSQPAVDHTEIRWPFYNPQSTVQNPPSPGYASLAYSTFLGGAGEEESLDLVVDPSGATYLTGETASTDFPTTPGAFSTTFSGVADAFVTHLSPDGSQLLFSTFLGGSGFDEAWGLAPAPGGELYVVGETRSTDFPVTPGGLQTTYGGGDSDAFIVRLGADGGLLYATYLGGADFDGAKSAAVDPWGRLVLTGKTGSPDFPVTPGAFQPQLGGVRDVFLSRLDPNGSRLLLSTYLGGARYDQGRGIALDASGAIYVAGTTKSSDYPTTPASFQPVYGGGLYDGFITKLDRTGARLVYSTFLGGDDYDYLFGLALAADGTVYTAGRSHSANFPVTPGAFQTGFAGIADATLTRLTADGAALLYSTYLGGAQEDFGYALALDPAGAAYLTGATASPDFPTSPGAWDPTFNGIRDTFVAVFPPTARSPYLSYLGGSGDDVGSAIVPAPGRAVLLTASTTSANYPVTPGAYQTALAGPSDAALTRLQLPLRPYSLLPASGHRRSTTNGPSAAISSAATTLTSSARTRQMDWIAACTAAVTVSPLASPASATCTDK